MLYRQNLVHGALLIVASELMFASMGAAVKAVSAGLSNEMTVFMRNLMGLLILLPWLLHQGIGSLKTQVLHLHALRALAGLSAMYCFFYALAHLPLADGMLLKMTAPIFMPLVAYVWLKEGATGLALIAVPIGFLGVGLVLRPDGEFNWVALIGLMGGALAAFAKVTVRRLGQTEPTVRTVFYFAVLAALVSSVPLSWAWQMPSGGQWGLLVLMGLMGTLGQLLLTRGYGIAAPSQVGPFTYFSVVFAAVYSYLFWGETLDAYFLAGAGLIALAGTLAIRGRTGVAPARRYEPAESESG